MKKLSGKTINILSWVFIALGIWWNILTKGLIQASIQLSIFLLIGIMAFALLKKYEWKFVRVIQVAGFGSFFIVILFGSILPDYFSSRMMFVSIFLILISITARWHLPKKKLKTSSLEERIKTDLKITTTTVKKKFPKIFNRIGGVVIPAIPFVSFINKGWKKKLNKEAIIHENVHLYYLQNGWLLGVIVVMSIILIPLSIVFSFVEEHMQFFSIILVVFILVHFEYITFNKTNHIANELGIRTRKWNKNLALIYFIIYSIQVSVIFFIIEGVKFIVKMLGRLV